MFQLNDIVFHQEHGLGEVVKIITDTETYRIRVDFDNGSIYSYTMDGRWASCGDIELILHKRNDYGTR
jgi:hypothetical protein